jgi:hypothetical protein
MQSQKISVMLGLVFLVANLARADKVSADYDHTVNFSKYKTFMWIREPETKDPFMKDRIIGSINAQLIARGLRQVSNEADLAIGANLATEEKHTWETYYSGSGWGWGWGDGWGDGWATTTVKTYEVGTLTIDLFDAQSRKLAWQGVAIDTISSKPEKRTKDTYKEIEKLFKDFPPRTPE